MASSWSLVSEYSVGLVLAFSGMPRRRPRKQEIIGTAGLSLKHLRRSPRYNRDAEEARVSHSPVLPPPPRE